MENNNCKNLIVNLLKSTIETEKTIQIQRNKVNQLYCFNSNFGYFKYIDKNKKNYIDYDDIVSFVSNFKIKCNQQKIKQIIKSYDKDCDHCWNFDEYLSFIQSSTNGLFTSSRLEENANNIENYEKELVSLFKKEIELLEYTGIKIKTIKSLLGSQLNIKQLYKDIKGENEFINCNALYYFFNNNSQSMMNDDIKLILKRFGDGNKITVKQFESLMSYDKFVSEKDTDYVRSKGYYKTNPIDNSKTLYYNVYAEYEQSKSTFSFK